MKVTICVGSTCHLLGSKSVVETFKALVEEYHLEDKVSLSGTFCMGKCGEGVCVNIDDENHIIQREDAEAFFKKKILAKVQ